MGGAWQFAAMLRAEESNPSDLPDAGITANTKGKKDGPCRDEGCTKGVCTACMVLQQS